MQLEEVEAFLEEACRKAKGWYSPTGPMAERLHACLSRTETVEFWAPVFRRKDGVAGQFAIAIATTRQLIFISDEDGDINPISYRAIKRVDVDEDGGDTRLLISGPRERPIVARTDERAQALALANFVNDNLGN